MGINKDCLHKFLSEYIWMSVMATKYEDTYSLGNLASYTIDELTELVKKINRHHRAYVGYIAGIAIMTCLQKWPEINDMPASGAVTKFLEIVGIDEPDELKL